MKIPMGWFADLMDKADKAYDLRFEAKKQWHSFFAILPRIDEDGDIVIGRIDRIGDYCYQGLSSTLGSVYSWEYRYRNRAKENK